MANTNIEQGENQLKLAVTTLVELSAAIRYCEDNYREQRDELIETILGIEL